MDWFTATYQVVRVIFIVLDVLLLAVLIFSAKKGWAFRPPLMAKNPVQKHDITTLNKSVFRERWQKMLVKITGTPDSMKHAIIEADSIVDGVLKDLRLDGEHMADRLKRLTKADFASLERVWRAHKMRNQLVHEPDFVITREDAAQALEDYEAFLKEADAL